MSMTPVSGPLPPVAAQPAKPQQQRALSDTFDEVFDASRIVQELDTDGDGTISDQEFAFYRAGKQARGEFVPASGPGTRPVAQSEQVAQATVDELLKRV
ncbi:hypothetical protein GGQ68_001400 [Sagittula marina]|uniref:EF-hand domain-containing protein n=1 Tax=Sagittula marina TaxID=943940 RepID=A0A7W6DKT3_9RHOB|nr:EF-hand domain-containing protein [Sagittula marina]MBB3985071.1 hypothetical protein [Sagittula marina]